MFATLLRMSGTIRGDIRKWFLQVGDQSERTEYEGTSFKEILMKTRGAKFNNLVQFKAGHRNEGEGIKGR